MMLFSDNTVFIIFTKVCNNYINVKKYHGYKQK